MIKYGNDGRFVTRVDVSNLINHDDDDDGLTDQL